MGSEIPGSEIHEKITSVVFPLPEDRYEEFLRLVERFPTPEDGDRGEFSPDIAEMVLSDLRESNVAVGVEASGRLVAAESGVINGERIFLNHAVVDSQFRGKGLLSQMENILIKAAREKGCRYVSAHISLCNVHSLVSHFKKGFVAYAHPQAPDFVKIIKDIDVKDQESLIPNGEAIEVPLSEIHEIEQRFKDGFVGVDLKNVSIQDGESVVADKENRNTSNWTLIMRKTDPGVLPWNRTVQ